MPCCAYDQRKLGSNTSVLRTNRFVRLDLDEGRCVTLHCITIHHKRIDLDEGRCETLHHITIHHKRIDLDEGRCVTLHYITTHHKRIDLDEGRCVTLHCITTHHKRIDLDEGRCVTLHYITIDSWGLRWGGSRSTKTCVFPCQVAAAGDETSCVRRLRLRSVCLFLPHCNGGFKLLWVCLRVLGYRVFWNLWLQIAVEWLHDCCHLVLPYV